MGGHEILVILLGSCVWKCVHTDSCHCMQFENFLTPGDKDTMQSKYLTCCTVSLDPGGSYFDMEFDPLVIGIGLLLFIESAHLLLLITCRLQTIHGHRIAR